MNTYLSWNTVLKPLHLHFEIGFLGTKMMTEKMRITQMKIGLQSILALGWVDTDTFVSPDTYFHLSSFGYTTYILLAFLHSVSMVL